MLKREVLQKLYYGRKLSMCDITKGLSVTPTTVTYWSRRLGIPKHFIAVNIHSDNRSKPDKQWSQYGIARIEVRNVKLKQWIDKELEKQIGKWN